MSSDQFGAFVPGALAEVTPMTDGALAGRSFVVKDLIDVAGYVTGGGNPDWAAAQSPARTHAPVVQSLLMAGAALHGKTITDELAFSLEGDNTHFPPTRNPLDATRLSGGSSSGSAVAVAAGLADFALGTDTGGSVRVPAAFCGLLGFRPTHGRLSLEGVLPFAPSLDTVGWFARAGALLAQVGEVLLGSKACEAPSRFLIADDVFELCDPGCAAPLRAVAARFKAEPVALMSDPSPWHQAYRAAQGREIAETLGPWIKRCAPRFGLTIAPRFADALAISDDDVADANAFRSAMRKKLGNLLPRGTALILPTTPGLALKRGFPGEEIGHFYQRALAINAIAGLCGLPQLTVPLATHDGLPLSLSFVMAAGEDESLLGLAKNLKP